jgi:hypothetical protein
MGFGIFWKGLLRHYQELDDYRVSKPRIAGEGRTVLADSIGGL